MSTPLDDLVLHQLREDSQRWELLIVEEGRRSVHDPLAKALLESMYWEPDRAAAFDRFLHSLDFAHTLQLLEGWGVRREDAICEIGGGSGFLCWALHHAGFRRVQLVEPNPHYVTGTGYLRTRDDAHRIEIENSLDRWHGSPDTFHAVITRNCLHHFPNLAFAAACIRRKIAPGGKWIVIREPIVESAYELYCFLHGHPYSQQYGVFEFAFPVSYYIEALELAGFQLRGIVPDGYANNCLSLYQPHAGARWNRWATRLIAGVLRHASRMSVAAYRIERVLRRWLRIRPRFTRPQVMCFQRVELGTLPAGVVWYPRRDEPSSKAA